MKNNISLIALSTCLFFASHMAFAASMDPVSESEISRAKSMAMPAPATATRLARRSVTTAAADEAADTAPTLEFLRVQPHRFKKSELSDNKRWADATAYDYRTDELVTTIVDLDNNQVLSTRRDKNLQPPLAANEIKRALEIVLQDDEERRILNSEFTRITGEVLSSIDQLQYKAFTFFSDSMPNAVNDASSSCGTHRCAQLLLYTHDNIVFEVSPIVNLSAGVVTQRMGY